MEPEIRYTTTADGASIAYYAMGERQAARHREQHLL
jgi:hypothetical protein